MNSKNRNISKFKSENLQTLYFYNYLFFQQLLFLQQLLIFQ